LPRARNGRAAVGAGFALRMRRSSAALLELKDLPARRRPGFVWTPGPPGLFFGPDQCTQALSRRLGSFARDIAGNGAGIGDRRVSLLDQLVGSTALNISRFPDFDHFCAIGQLGDARSIPLDLRNFTTSFAAMKLNSCSIYLQQTFPRILQSTYLTRGAIVALAMDDATSVTINGMEAGSPMLLFARGRVPCEMVEPRANLVAFIAFDSVDRRDWPGEVDRLQLVATRPAEYTALRSVVRDALALASQSPEAMALPNMTGNLEESLLQAVDRAVHAAPPLEQKRANLAHYVALVRSLDELLSFNVSGAVYSADVAQQLGVSVRTLHNAVVTIRGMSLHRYVRLKRLWSVRQQLALGSSAVFIKAVALANGFWHMGEFSSLYRNTFGETPQQTLAAARDRCR
jgi:AraC family ethanolamine operon transcriptional activator